MSSRLATVTRNTMTETPATLLHRLCNQPVDGDWERFVRLFTPLLQRWARRLGVNNDAAEDLLQETFVLLIRKLPEFQYDPSKSFRAWLWTVFRHTALALHKRKPCAGAAEQLEQLVSPDSVVEASEAEYRRYLLGRVVQIVQKDFPESTWNIFRMVAIEGRAGVDVARECGVSVNAVYLARGRVLARLREELSGLDQ
jgi:RNA polymerase sigma-70 factor, ECF subfamily